jgi:hypothetical protein
MRTAELSFSGILQQGRSRSLDVLRVKPMALQESPKELEPVSTPPRKGDRHILLRGLRKMSQSPAVLKLALGTSLPRIGNGTSPGLSRGFVIPNPAPPSDIPHPASFRVPPTPPNRGIYVAKNRISRHKSPVERARHPPSHTLCPPTEGYMSPKIAFATILPTSCARHPASAVQHPATQSSPQNRAFRTRPAPPAPVTMESPRCP